MIYNMKFASVEEQNQGVSIFRETYMIYQYNRTTRSFNLENFISKIYTYIHYNDTIISTRPSDDQNMNGVGENAGITAGA